MLVAVPKAVWCMATSVGECTQPIQFERVICAHKEVWQRYRFDRACAWLCAVLIRQAYLDGEPVLSVCGL